jgi:DedD protein
MTFVTARDKEDNQEPEITLSTASLLGLFLGLVLVCGVFFGFGYSMGRRATANAAAALTATGSTDDLDNLGHSGAAKSPAAANRATQSDSTLPSEDTSPIAGDSAPALPASAVSALRTDASSAPDSSALTASRRDSATAPHTSAPSPSKAASVPVAATLPAPQQNVETASTSKTMPKAGDVRPGSGQAMVQVAAVVHQEDADVLVSALRKRGYSVVVRNEPQDKLLHVQVGPFATRMEANAMKQKLASDGYDAIIKQ